MMYYLTANVMGRQLKSSEIASRIGGLGTTLGHYFKKAITFQPKNYPVNKIFDRTWVGCCDMFYLQRQRRSTSDESGCCCSSCS